MLSFRFAALVFACASVQVFAQVPLASRLHDALSNAERKQAHADSSAIAFAAIAQSRIDSLQQIISSRIDSLRNLSQDAEEYLQVADSLARLGQGTLLELPDNLDAWKQSIESKYASLEQKVNGRLTTAQVRLAEALPDVANVPGLPSLSSDRDGFLSRPLEALRGRIPELPGLDLPLIDLPLDQIKLRSFDLPQIDQPFGSLPDFSSIADKVGSYGGEFSSLARGDFSNLDDLSNTLEDRLAATGPMMEFSDQAGDLVEQWKAYERIASLGQDTAALKDFALEKVHKYATDHLAGKEEMLKTALDKVSKLKSKYSSVTSLADLPKRPPNPMKGRKWYERLVPSLTLQVQKSDYLFVDLNPALGWRFNGYLTAGAGWNDRVGINGYLQYSVSGRVYGPRLFTEVGLSRGFAVRADGELMNTMMSTSVTSESGREWVPGIFAGIKKDYRLFKNVRGNIQVLYNLYDDHGNSPYPDRLVMRVGMQFRSGGKNKRIQNSE